MPVYAYKCPKCGFVVELSRSVADHSSSKPSCAQDGCDGLQVMETQVQPAGFVLKGSGWTKKGS